MRIDQAIIGAYAAARKVFDAVLFTLGQTAAFHVLLPLWYMVEQLKAGMNHDAN